VLYAYLGPDDEILYVGKVAASGSSVRRRWEADDKLRGFWCDLERERHIYEHVALLGEVHPGLGKKLTSQLLGDLKDSSSRRSGPGETYNAKVVEPTRGQDW
jgi:hypothetical protein